MGKEINIGEVLCNGAFDFIALSLSVFQKNCQTLVVSSTKQRALPCVDMAVWAKEAMQLPIGTRAVAGIQVHCHRFSLFIYFFF